MDPLESARCPQCQKVYPLNKIHFCPFARGFDDPLNPERYSQYGAVSFQVIVLQNEHCMHGEQQRRRDLVLGGVDGCVVIDIIKATALVRWTTRQTHPKADEYVGGNGYGERYPRMIETQHVEPRECLIAVIGESKDQVVAELTAKLDEANRSRSDAWGKSVDAGVKAQAQEALAKVEADNEHLKKHAVTTDRALSSAANARDEAHRLVKDMQAELARIKAKVGTERFDELRRA